MTYSQAGWRLGSRWLHRHTWWCRRLAEPLPPKTVTVKVRRHVHRGLSRLRVGSVKKYNAKTKAETRNSRTTHPKAAVLGGLDEQVAILCHELGLRLPPDRSPADDALVGSLVKSATGARGRKGRGVNSNPGHRVWVAVTKFEDPATETATQSRGPVCR